MKKYQSILIRSLLPVVLLTACKPQENTKRESPMFREQSPLPDKSAIIEFEKKYKIQLPQDYIQFLIQHGGGSFSHDMVITFKSLDPMDKGLGAEPLGDFYSISSSNEFRLLSDAMDHYRSPIEFVDEVYVKPKEFMPIANNSFGDDYCIGISEPVLGEIYMHIHDFSGVNGVKEDPRFPNFYFIATSFNEFIERIMSGEEYEELY